MRTAVVVDDEPITRLDFSEMLASAGFEIVAQCADGFDALDICRSRHPDVVLMDIRMPMFDGLSAAETIIKEEAAGCVILLTAFSDSEFIERAKQIGVAGYLVKPVEERILLPTIEMAVAQTRRYRSAVEETRQIKSKLEEKALVDRAKLIVARRDGITEGEAYARIQKMSMDKRCSMAQIATMLVNYSGEDREAVDRAKQLLMKRHGISEGAAYKRLCAAAEKRGSSTGEVARELLLT